MLPIEVSPWEDRQVSLLIKRYGSDPAAFNLRKFVRRDGGGYRVRVVARSAATLYDSATPHEWTRRFADDLRAGVFGNPVQVLPEGVAAAFAQTQRALALGGLQDALKVLNARVPHRFTAVYRLEGTVLQSVALVDKHLHLDPLDLRTVPLRESFCQFVLRDGLFLTQESGGDPRLAGHPYQGVMGCYVGVPIQRGGAMAGSLCHFDLQSQELADEEFLLLDQVARLLPAFL